MACNFEEAMRGFPSFHDLDTVCVSHERLTGLLYSLEEEADDDDVCTDETICKLNFKTWIYTKLENLTKAEEINNKVIQYTNWKNVISIGNRIFLSWRAGKENEARECFDKLYYLKESKDCSDRLEFANAELAYSYSRTGQPENLLKAIHILEEFVRLYPREYFWKLRLGLVYRRSARYNINAGMSQGPTIKECIIKAHTFLTDVANNSIDNKLRGPALSELAVLCKFFKTSLSDEDYIRIFKKRSSIAFAKEALKYGDKSTWVMANCADILWKEEEAILTRCLTYRKNTTTYAKLGKYFMKKAKADAASEQGVNIPTGYRNREVDTLLLKLPNENFDKAQYNFVKAIEISHNQNLPAIFQLGMLYKLVGLIKDALETFNKITNRADEEHMVTIIAAHEQAGFCYLKMKGSEKFAEEKLTRAIVLAVKAVSSCPELPIKATEIWEYFKKTQKRLKEENVPAVKNIELLQLRDLVKNHSNGVTVLKDFLTLTDSDLKDPQTIMSWINSYLEKNEPEKALTFLNMLSIPHDITTSESCRSQEMINLMYRVFLQVAENRLKCQINARFIFKDLFKLKFGQCNTGISKEIADVKNMRDVLLLYDEYCGAELNPTSKTVEGLQDIVSSVFGLSSSTNLQAN